MMLLIVLAIVVMIAFMTILFSDKLLQMVAGKVITEREGQPNPEKEKAYSLFPQKEELLPTENHAVAGKQKVHKLSKGLKIKIKGKAAQKSTKKITKTYAVKPIDFNGLKPIPKLLVEEGAAVKAGEPLFFDKNYPDVKFSSPVSGKVAEVRRGEKRAIHEVIVEADSDIQFFDYPTVDVKSASAEAIKEQLIASGAWTYFIERPFGVVANVENEPKAIHISTFDSSPLSANYNYTLQGEDQFFQAGIDAIAKLTKRVHLNLDANAAPASIFANANGVQKNWFEGVHPAGNVGIQIHHVDPINANETVWTIKPEDVVAIGKMFVTGKLDTLRKVAIAGPRIETPHYIETYRGANIAELLDGNIEGDNNRIISGNVLTGRQVTAESHLGYYDNCISVIEEGDFYELFGWILPSYPRPSLSVTFPWKLLPWFEFEPNTNTHGELRAFVVTGQYEEVTPMDLYPVQLLKAIMARDFEQMEGLGIYEVLEEDLALCEFVCTSKQPVQAILRDGLDYMREQV